MSRAKAEASISMGASVLKRELERGLDLVATGDMGIANTTAASAVVAALTGSPPADVVGKGLALTIRPTRGMYVRSTSSALAASNGM